MGVLPTGIKIKSSFRGGVGGETQRRCTIIAQLSTLAKTRKAWKRVINPTGTLSLLEQNKQVDSWDWGQAQVAFLVETDPIVRIVSRTQLSALSTNCLQLTYGHWPSGSLRFPLWRPTFYFSASSRCPGTNPLFYNFLLFCVLAGALVPVSLSRSLAAFRITVLRKN